MSQQFPRVLIIASLYGFAHKTHFISEAIDRLLGSHLSPSNLATAHTVSDAAFWIVVGLALWQLFPVVARTIRNAMNLFLAVHTGCEQATNVIIRWLQRGLRRCFRSARERLLNWLVGKLAASLNRPDSS